MKSKFLVASLALLLLSGSIANAQDCGCNGANPCNACDTCNSHRCDLFAGLKNLLKHKPVSLSACGPCDAVVACSPCDPTVVACEPAVQACEPVITSCDPVVSCEPVCDPVCATDCGGFGFTHSGDRPLLRAAHKTKANISRFFNGLFGSLKGCTCGLCTAGGSCNASACDPIAACQPACAPIDPCAPTCYTTGTTVLPAAPQE
ncbi:MAG: hypothetical protein LBJ67_15415 [Planctomycetaceae bacterium]|jgi:hypothetical protein|nr:hypothetical protein [Planctomycetaceae bacterium]